LHISIDRNLDAHASMLTFPAQNVVMAKVAWMTETKRQPRLDGTGKEVVEVLTDPLLPSKVPLSILKEK